MPEASRSLYVLRPQVAQYEKRPDECEEESLWGGGGGSMMSGGAGGGEFNEQAAWELFYEWFDEQVLGEESDWPTLTGSQRFERVMDELALLGLPYARPW